MFHQELDAQAEQLLNDFLRDERQKQQQRQARLSQEEQTNPALSSISQTDANYSQGAPETGDRGRERDGERNQERPGAERGRATSAVSEQSASQHAVPFWSEEQLLATVDAIVAEVDEAWREEASEKVEAAVPKNDRPAFRIAVTDYQNKTVEELRRGFESLQNKNKELARKMKFNFNDSAFFPDGEVTEECLKEAFKHEKRLQSYLKLVLGNETLSDQLLRNIIDPASINHQFPPYNPPGEPQYVQTSSPARPDQQSVGLHTVSGVTAGGSVHLFRQNSQQQMRTAGLPVPMHDNRCWVSETFPRAVGPMKSSDFQPMVHEGDLRQHPNEVCLSQQYERGGGQYYSNPIIRDQMPLQQAPTMFYCGDQPTQQPPQLRSHEQFFSNMPPNFPQQLQPCNRFINNQQPFPQQPLQQESIKMFHGPVPDLQQPRDLMVSSQAQQQPRDLMVSSQAQQQSRDLMVSSQAQQQRYDRFPSSISGPPRIQQQFTGCFVGSQPQQLQNQFMGNRQQPHDQFMYHQQHQSVSGFVAVQQHQPRNRIVTSQHQQQLHERSVNSQPPQQHTHERSLGPPQQQLPPMKSQDQFVHPQQQQLLESLQAHDPIVSFRDNQALEQPGMYRYYQPAFSHPSPSHQVGENCNISMYPQGSMPPPQQAPADSVQHQEHQQQPPQMYSQQPYQSQKAHDFKQASPETIDQVLTDDSQLFNRPFNPTDTFQGLNSMQCESLDGAILGSELPPVISAEPMSPGVANTPAPLSAEDSYRR